MSERSVRLGQYAQRVDDWESGIKVGSKLTADEAWATIERLQDTLAAEQARSRGLEEALREIAEFACNTCQAEVDALGSGQCAGCRALEALSACGAGPGGEGNNDG